MILRDYQEEAVTSLWNYFFKKSGNPIVAMPTGSGKSLIIASYIKMLLEVAPDARVLMVTHVKELVQQNYEKLITIYPEANVGIFSASLGIKSYREPIIFAGIDSIVNKIGNFELFNAVIIDECHLINFEKGKRYHKLITVLKEKNPNCVFIGLTATPYRMGNGLLIDNGLFTDTAYNLCSLDNFNTLIQNGYLSPLVTYKQAYEYDVSNVKYTSNDFVLTDLNKVVNRAEVTQTIVEDLTKKLIDRKKWLIFSSGLEHSVSIKDAILELCPNKKIEIVDSKMTNEMRDIIIDKFRCGKIDAIINYNILTTGFDVADIDAIVVMRPTKSTVLWVQMLGRGTRPSPGKENCLVLDYAGNTSRLGQINDPVIPAKKGNRKGQAPVKECPDCSLMVHISVRICTCGHEFVFNNKLTEETSTTRLIADNKPVIEILKVTDMDCTSRISKNGNSMLEVKYNCNSLTFRQFFLFEKVGYNRVKSIQWFEKLCDMQVPETCDEVEELYRRGLICTPSEIKVFMNKKPYPEILEVFYDKLTLELNENNEEEVPF